MPIQSPTSRDLARKSIIELAQNVYNNALFTQELADSLDPTASAVRGLKEEAESARDAAQEAKGDAESARDGALAAEADARGYSQTASVYADNASADADNAAESAALAAQSAADAPTNATQAVTALLQQIYRVNGQPFMSFTDVNPAIVLGFGTWQRIRGTFLYAEDDTHPAGSTGGSNDAVVVAHRHAVEARAGASTGSYYSAVPWTSNTGSGGYATDTTEVGVDGAGKNMPAYTAIYMWRRTA